jgi:hypothetical protein
LNTRATGQGRSDVCECGHSWIGCGHLKLKALNKMMKEPKNAAT